MSIETIGKSLGAIVDERFSSPLVSSFVISWSIINWKFLVVLFSNNTVSTTFDLAQRLYPTRLDWWGWNAAAPLAAALAYVYLLPLASRPVFRQWRENQQAVEADRKEVEKLTMLDLRESQKISEENYRLRDENDQLRVEVVQAKADVKNASKAQSHAQQQRDEAKGTATAVMKQLDESNKALQLALKECRNGTVLSNALRDILKVTIGNDDPYEQLDKLIAQTLKNEGKSPSLLSRSELQVLEQVPVNESANAAAVARRIGMEPAAAQQIFDSLQSSLYLKVVFPTGRGTPVGYVLTKSGVEAQSMAKHYRRMVAIAMKAEPVDEDSGGKKST